MSPSSLRERAARTIDAASAVARHAAPLVTRLVIGAGFVMTGLGKWKHLDATAAFFGSAGIPAPFANAVFVSTLEVVGGALLVAGLMTRTFALLLSSTMVVALLTADRGAFAGALGGSRALTDVTAVVFLMLLLWLAGWGAGAVSLDAALGRKSSREAMACRLAAAKA